MDTKRCFVQQTVQYFFIMLLFTEWYLPSDKHQIQCLVACIQFTKEPLIPDVKSFCSVFLGDDALCSSRGWQGLIAYGCHSLVLVVDANSAQTLQVLERHKASVVKVRCTWFMVCCLVLGFMLSF